MVYLLGTLVGTALIVLGVHEMQFLRRAAMKPVGLAMFLAGLATAIIGVVTLHITDEIGGNWLGAVLIGAGVLVGLYGLATWRYEPLASSGALTFTPAILKPLAIGVGLLVLSIISAIGLRCRLE